jgi:integrase
MATISKLPSGRFRAQIRRKGFAEIHQIFNSHAEAEAWVNDVEPRLLGKDVQQQVSAATLRDIWKSYHLSTTFANKRPATRIRETHAWAPIDRLVGGVPIAGLSEQAVQIQFFDPRTAEKNKQGGRISGDTVRIERALLSQLFSYGKRRGLVTYNPIKGGDFDLPKCRPREGRINRIMEQKLYDTAKIHLNKGFDWAAFEEGKAGEDSKENLSGVNWLIYMFNTGSRPGEASKIKLSWISSDFTRINVPAANHKPDHPRIVLTDHIKFKLEGWVDNAEKQGSEWLFYSFTQKDMKVIPRPFDYSAFWRRVAKKAAVEKGITPHIIRHEFISRLFEETNLSDRQIATLVGDKNPASLQPYAHLRTGLLAPNLQSHNFAELLRRIEENKPSE